MSKATYYVRYSSYWQNSPDRWAGPFDSKPEAQQTIDDCNPDIDMRNGIRINGIYSKTEARKISLRSYALGDNEDNNPSKQIPESL